MKSNNESVLSLFKSGIKKAEIARRVGLSRERISQIIGKTPEQTMKRACREQLAKAVKNGIVVKQPCSVCGETKSEAHHEDYNKPYDVIWLCRYHHSALHHPNLKVEAKKPHSKRKPNKKVVREITRTNVAAMRERQDKQAKALGYTSIQNLGTRVLNNDLTPQHIEYLKEVMK
jgi:hypothetical protein